MQDRRHAIVVARRFVALAGQPSRDEVAGALLHDVGKQASGLGTFARVLGTLVGPRGAKFRTYHDHEALGAAMATEAGSTSDTVALILGAYLHIQWRTVRGLAPERLVAIAVVALGCAFGGGIPGAYLGATAVVVGIAHGISRRRYQRREPAHVSHAG